MRAVLLLVTLLSCCFAEETPEKLIEAGHWKRARAIVERRLAEAPNDARATFLASQIHYAFGDHVSPLGLAEKAVRLDGGVGRYHRQLAEVQGVMAQRAGIFEQLLLAGRFRKEIDLALELDPRDVQALRDEMEFYLVAPGIVGGDVKRAEDAARRIAALEPPEGFLAKARIAEFRKDPAKAQEMLCAAADARPLSYRAQMALAQFYLAQGGRDEKAAEAPARTALSLDAGRAGAYAVLAAIYAGRADWTALEATLSAAVQSVPDDPAPYYRAAERLLAARRDPARAERYLRTYLAQEAEGNEPTADDAQRELGLALRAQGRYAGTASAARGTGSPN